MAHLKYSTRLLRPGMTLKRLQQELYAMFRTAGDDTDIDPAAGPESPSLAHRVDTPSGRVEAVRSRTEELFGSSEQGRAASEAVDEQIRRREPPVRERIETRPEPPVPVIEDRRRAASAPAALPERVARTRPPSNPPPTRPRPTPDAAPAPPRRSPVIPPERRPVDQPRREEPPRERTVALDAKKPEERDPGTFARDTTEFDLPKIPGYFPDLLKGGAGTTVFLGKVVSHTSGDPASVNLYPDGPEGDPDPAGPFDVTIPTLADGETLPANLWLGAVHQFTNTAGDAVYYSQPPIWLG